jgi:DNA-binding HxlR family transcriptional regulator
MLEKLEEAGLVARICDDRVDFHTHWYITEKGVAELEAGVSSLVMLLDRMAQVKKEAPRLRGPNDIDQVASIIEDETEKLIGHTA